MNIYDQLDRDESIRLKPYRDNCKEIGFEGRQGKLTIGIGRNLDDRGISKEEARYLRDNDVAAVTAELRRHLPWVSELDGARFGVLQNMGFNMGVPGLLEFRHMLAWLQAGNYIKAAAEMTDSLWYPQVGARAARLVKQMITGEWQ